MHFPLQPFNTSSHSVFLWGAAGLAAFKTRKAVYDLGVDHVVPLKRGGADTSLYVDLELAVL